MVELLEAPSIKTPLVVVAAERSYRREFLQLVLGDISRVSGHTKPLTVNEAQQLLERYRQFGLVGEKFATKRPRDFAERIHKEPVAIQVCQILNDFRPMETIVDSLWEAAEPDDRLPYLCVALAQHCYSAGVRYSILQAIMGPTKPVGRLMSEIPLRLAANAAQDAYVIAINSTIAERVLRRASLRENDILFAAFAGLARALAPYVNRMAIMRRSPEARLAGRLFDGDKIVKPLLDSAAEQFYVESQKLWEWNSRYWEQRALLKADSDLVTALRYAKQAVAIENHPFPLTTLAKLLLKTIEAEPHNRSSLFNDAFDALTRAIETEARRSRITVHPFGILLGGAAMHLELGGTLTPHQRAALDGYAEEARHRFSRDPLIEGALTRLEACKL